MGFTARDYLNQHRPAMSRRSNYRGKAPFSKLTAAAVKREAGSSASTCSPEKLKADFDRAIAAMSDQEIIEAFREAGCEVTIQRQENPTGQGREPSPAPDCSNQ
jgi:hypothetical protein